MTSESLVTPEPAVRLRLDLAYDGAEFSGWSRQPGLRTVQGELEAALATIVARAVPDQPTPTLTVAGRTDAGVHATGQVAHLDLSAEQWGAVSARRRSAADEHDPQSSLVRRLNGIAGAEGDLVVHRASIAPAGFDARFSPVWRRYEYRLADAVASRDPRRRGHTLWYPAALDGGAMDAAARALEGLHDFAAFCRPREGATTIRTLLDYTWARDDDGVLVAAVRADAFCHSMVRALVGAAVAVGLGRLDAERLVAIRDGAARTSDFPVLGAKGLTLMEVGYPDDAALAARAEQTRAKRELTAEPR
ncbi:tRNA pseudouridine(38-40) synthase TruA [Yonghaparkia sp. Root332]|uniref:tRNA pseudouridine synthase A n=1 Tax=Yonghaparkia sp. Root332 TaxID=1736516 RepID=UPI000AF3A34F|nr:tRNA pseudouridine synthase A [Yonghaparkia sp. Root332]